MADVPPAAPPAPPPPPPPPSGGAEPWPPLVPAITPPPGVLGRIAVVLAGLALLGYLAAAVLLAVPVSTPEVQDCGAPGAYLLDGRLDRVPDGDGRLLDAEGEVVTLDDDVAEVARTTPCRERVAARAVPAALLVVAAVVVGLVAFAIELLLVRPRQRRAVRASWGAPPGGSRG